MSLFVNQGVGLRFLFPASRLRYLPRAACQKQGVSVNFCSRIEVSQSFWWIPIGAYLRSNGCCSLDATNAPGSFSHIASRWLIGGLRMLFIAVKRRGYLLKLCGIGEHQALRN